MSWGSISNNDGMVVYQKALRFVMALYGVCELFPPSERENLTVLVKKAAVAVTTHISEGCKKTSTTEKIRFLRTAQGYLEECGYYLNLTEQLGYTDTSSEKTELKIVGDLLAEYIDSLD
jgi:four helix bundle protein